VERGGGGAQGWCRQWITVGDGGSVMSKLDFVNCRGGGDDDLLQGIEDVRGGGKLIGRRMKRGGAGRRRWWWWRGSPTIGACQRRKSTWGHAIGRSNQLLVHARNA
jgi:hypothetical protein